MREHAARQVQSARVLRCTTCARCFVALDEDRAEGRACGCGGELEETALPSGLYELTASVPIAVTRAPRHARPDTVSRPEMGEADLGYGSSHGYSRGHGGPTGPSDAPATETPDAKPAEVESRR